MLDKNKLISIIMVTKNAEKYLDKALKSLCSQNYDNYEIVVLDAGSTDKTMEIFNKYKDKIGYCRSHKDDGAMPAYNEGIANAKGKLVTFFNSDDFYEGDVLQQVETAYNNNPDALVYTIGAKFYDSNMVLKSKYYQDMIGLENIISGLYTPFINARFFSKEIFNKFGSFILYKEDGSEFLSSDQDYMIRSIINKAPEVKVKGEVFYSYMMHSGSSTMSGNKKRVFKTLQEHVDLGMQYINIIDSFDRKSKIEVFIWHYKNIIKTIIYSILFFDVKILSKTLKALLNHKMHFNVVKSILTSN